MTKNDLKIARELKSRLAAQTELVDFRVFGSRARGDAEADADMDVFVEVETLTPAAREKSLETTREPGFLNNVLISPQSVSLYEVEQTALHSSAIVRNITHKGIAV